MVELEDFVTEPVGSTFVKRGIILEVQPEQGTDIADLCRGCYFRQDSTCVNPDRHLTCLASLREDNRGVIFVKKGECDE